MRTRAESTDYFYPTAGFDAAPAALAAGCGSP
jgi:hypothetical protein